MTVEVARAVEDVVVGLAGGADDELGGLAAAQKARRAVLDASTVSMAAMAFDSAALRGRCGEVLGSGASEVDGETVGEANGPLDVVKATPGMILVDVTAKPSRSRKMASFEHARLDFLSVAGRQSEKSPSTEPPAVEVEEERRRSPPAGRRPGDFERWQLMAQ
jgi:hypothetical protein